jgi:hypothetical protein
MNNVARGVPEAEVAHVQDRNSRPAAKKLLHDFVHHHAREGHLRSNLAGDCQTHSLHSGSFLYLFKDVVDLIGNFLGMVMPPDSAQNPDGLQSIAAAVVRNPHVRQSQRRGGVRFEHGFVSLDRPSEVLGSFGALAMLIGNRGAKSLGVIGSGIDGRHKHQRTYQFNDAGEFAA